MLSKIKNINDFKKTDHKPHVVIIGGGFGGLNALNTLAGLPVNVTLIDRNNYHTFLPLLYQVAAAELDPSDITYPIRGIIRKIPNARFILAQVEKIDFKNKRIETTGPSLTYDYLILSPGSVTRFFKVPGARDFSFRLKNIEEAIALRNQIICCFENGTQDLELKNLEKRLTFIIVGGGATGIEYAGALSELIRGSFIRDFPEIDASKYRIILLEAGQSILPSFPSHLREYALNILKKKGVDVRLSTKVTEVRKDGVMLATGEFILSDTTVWTAGVRGTPRAIGWGLPVTPSGCVKVSPTLQAVNFPEVYIIGDLAYFENNGKPLPQVAPVAVQQGILTAKNILRQIMGDSPTPFHYKDKGSMVVIGRNSAVVSVGKLSFVGFSAWALWLVIHLAYLIGFRNRWSVLFNWAWDYISFERYIRMILPKISAPHNLKTKCSVCFSNPDCEFEED
ncbi:MAG: NAD(P)/FAD-dependent oxidoreductase [Desulfobacterales bacterium]|nr:NAD(P)/FAD-dependent oxidoreductase [Desulfobacterales bacterium]MBF0399087.1 NAD(P)/FAD-dependent oxidoreductase [Desulfobacterales bacterium]